jgi:hypothetical protein
MVEVSQPGPELSTTLAFERVNLPRPERRIALHWVPTEI